MSHRWRMKEMLKKDLFQLQKILNSLKNIQNTRFSYVVLKNLRKINAEIEVLDNLQQMNDNIIREYEEERIALCIQHAEKNDKDEPVIENNRYRMLDMDAFSKELEELRSKYEEDINAHSKGQEEYTRLLMERCDIDFYKIKYDNLPDNLTTLQLELLLNIIED